MSDNYVVLFLFLLKVEASGIFVKNIIPGSAAEQSGQIKVDDKIIAVSESQFEFNILHCTTSLPNAKD